MTCLEARKRIYDYLNKLACKLRPGESGLLALDWWNGNRSVLCDYELSGLILGLTIRTRSEEIYRALIESIAFGTRCIIETFEQNGIPIKSITACGGIAKKNPLFMQICSDVLNREIRISHHKQASALGSSIFAAVAAGSEKEGYDYVEEAAKKMAGTCDRVYIPNPSYQVIYNELYSEYLALQSYFGGSANNVMKRLRKFHS